MQQKLYTIVIVLLLSAVNLAGRSKRVNQIPNGVSFRCANCHIDPGGGERNKFGTTVENSFLDGSGNVIWGSALAGIDSDLDDKTNGEELQDANGEWTSGSANPGDANLVSNPGDPSSTTDVHVTAFRVPTTMHLHQNYPNPFNPSTTISFSLAENITISLRIYNSLGHPVRELVHGILLAGKHDIYWNGLNEVGEVMGSGVYIAKLEGGGKGTRVDYPSLASFESFHLNV